MTLEMINLWTKHLLIESEYLLTNMLVMRAVLARLPASALLSGLVTLYHSYSTTLHYRIIFRGS